jgi:23S rRNA (cytosine1962-C5)-methyltransferase
MTEEEHDDWMGQSIEAVMEVLAVSKENIYLKLRQRKPGRLGQYQKYDQVRHEYEVGENGLKFLVNLNDYLDTGLFLDHRITRQLVKEQSAGRKVLNLFAYTGSFSVYAAAGGATELVTVDLSKTYLDWAERNMKLNGFSDPGRYSFIQADAVQYLKTIPAGFFDIIVMDPPTFSNSKRMDDFLDIQRDHASLINDCIRGLKTGGLLYFSTNYRKFLLDEDRIKGAVISDITKTTTPFDFEGKLARYCFKLKRVDNS